MLILYEVAEIMSASENVLFEIVTHFYEKWSIAPLVIEWKKEKALTLILYGFESLSISDRCYIPT